MRHMKKLLCAALAAFMMLVGTSCGGFGDILFGDDTTAAPEIHTESAENTDPEPGEVETPEEKTTEEETTEEKTTEEETTQHVHTEEVLVEVTPSCTETGLTEGKHCSVCNQVLVAQKVVPAKGHTAGEWVVDREPEVGIEGSKHTTCIVCGAVYEEPIEMLYSQGLAYIANGDGTCSVSGIGNCTDKNVFIPKTYNGMTVTEIESYAFRGCQELISVVIPDKVTWVGTGAFSGCDKLVVEENGVRYVDKWVVDCDSSVTDVVLRESTQGIAFQAFTYCHNLKTISIPSGVSNVTKHMFSDSSQVFVEDKGIIYVDRWVVGGDRTASEIVLRDDTVGIGSEAFLQNDNIVSVVIPDSVMHIGPGVFSGCEKLTFIKIGNGVTSICNHAFSGCRNLSSVVIGSNVTSIGDRAFANCHNLTSINIPDSVTSIGEGAFCNCDSLTSITIPAGVTEIKEGAFLGCHGLNEIQISEGNQHYVVLDDMLFTKDMSVLIWCSHRKNTVAVPDGVTRIGNYAFFAMVNLTSVTLPDSVTSMGDSVFDNCHNLTSVIIPDGVTSIGDSSFNWCEKMTSIIIPNGVTSIGERAFSNCIKLTSVIIPSNVTNIDRSAFVDCSSLTDIYFTGTESEWNAITKGTDWDSGTPSYTVHFNYVP